MFAEKLKKLIFNQLKQKNEFGGNKLFLRAVLSPLHFTGFSFRAPSGAHHLDTTVQGTIHCFQASHSNPNPVFGILESRLMFCLPLLQPLNRFKLLILSFIYLKSSRMTDDSRHLSPKTCTPAVMESDCSDFLTDSLFASQHGPPSVVAGERSSL